MATEIWINIGSGNGLLPSGNKPLPEPMLTNRQSCLVTFTLGQCDARNGQHAQGFYLRYAFYYFHITAVSPRGQWVKVPLAISDFPKCHPYTSGTIRTMESHKIVWYFKGWYQIKPSDNAEASIDLIAKWSISVWLWHFHWLFSDPKVTQEINDLDSCSLPIICPNMQK